MTPSTREMVCGFVFSPRPWLNTTAHCGERSGHDGQHRVSTRRVSSTGVVHDMAAFGVRTLCGIDLAEPWTWTDDPVSCLRCEAQVSP